MEQPPSKETRVPVNLRIKFRSETIEQFVERYAVDVSRGGIFIRTREPLAVGTQLKFDFQLQNTSPLMAGEGTVVWIREHDPNRAGVTPGMGVRFDKLTPASQSVLDKILADKGKREPSGPNANTVSGKSGVAPLPRRPSSTFSAVDPAALGLPSTGGTQPGVGSPPLGGPVPGPTANPFAASSPSGLSPSPLARPTQPLSSLSSPPLGTPKPSAGAPGSGAGALPTLESQSALGRLATGPNLSAFGPVGAPRTKSPVPLPSKQATGDASGRVTATSAPAVPTSVEDSERTQIADGLPEFANDQPTHVGGPALGLSEIAAGRAPTITATSRRVPTPAPQPKLSLDDMAAPAPSASAEPAAPASRPTSPDGGAASSVVSRTTSPDGSAGADAAAAAAKRPSGSRPSVPHVGAHPAPGTLETDLLSTVPASARISAVTPSVRADTPFATRRVERKKRPIATVIIIGALAGAAAAAGVVYKLSNRAPEETAAPAQADNGGLAAAPGAASATAPAAANPAAPEGTKTEPVVANPATGEAKVGEAKTGETAVAEPKAGEAKAGEAKPAEGKAAGPAAAEAKSAEAKPAEAKPAETKVAAVDPAAPTAKGGKRPRPTPHKKGAAGAKGDEATAGDSGGDDTANLARVISLPTGAEVLIDGQSVGKTPFLGKDIDPAAPHALTVRKEGFETYEHMVSASDWIKGKGPGQSLRVTVKLHKAAGGGEAKPAGDDKAEKPEKPAAPSEPAKTEPPPASETP